MKSVSYSRPFVLRHVSHGAVEEMMRTYMIENSKITYTLKKAANVSATLEDEDEA